MGKNRKGNGNQNQQVNNNQQDQKKPGLIKRIKTWPQRHPRITKGVKIGAAVVGGTLAAVGGAGLTMAVKERYGTKPETPGLPETPQLTMPDPGPVYPEE